MPSAPFSCAAAPTKHLVIQNVPVQGRVDDAPAAVATTPAAVPLLKRLVHDELSPQQVQLRDKIGFVAGIANIA